MFKQMKEYFSTPNEIVVHPLLFAAYPVLSLLAFNLNQTRIIEAGRSLGIVLLGSILLTAGLTLLLRNGHRAGLMTSAFFLLFFSFGHIAESLDRVLPDDSIEQNEIGRYLSAAWVAILLVTCWWVWRVLKKEIGPVTKFLNTVAAVALMFPTYAILERAVFTDEIQMAQSVDYSNDKTMGDVDGSKFPDIYYIIMDGYTNAEILQEVFDYDNSDFIDFLANKGFRIIHSGRSNYGQTRLSLASSMNFEYVNHLADRVGIDSPDRTPLAELIQNNRLQTILQSHGYRTVAVSSGFAATELRDADVYIKSNASMLNEFERILLEKSMLGPLVGPHLEFAVKRQRTLFIFDELKKIPKISGPKFVFVHVLAPHVPIVFGPNGEHVKPVRVNDPYSPDAIAYARNLYLSEYRGEVIFLNKLLKDSINRIITDSERTPIIVLQGDHGSRTYLNYQSVEHTCVRERLSILNAYYLPEEGAEKLYESITPVNSFRIVLNHYFDADMSLLQDRSYYTLWDRPYNFYDVTNEFEPSCSSNREE